MAFINPDPQSGNGLRRAAGMAFLATVQNICLIFTEGCIKKPC